MTDYKRRGVTSCCAANGRLFRRCPRPGGLAKAGPKRRANEMTIKKEDDGGDEEAYGRGDVQSSETEGR